MATDCFYWKLTFVQQILNKSMKNYFKNFHRLKLNKKNRCVFVKSKMKSTSKLVVTN